MARKKSVHSTGQIPDGIDIEKEVIEEVIEKEGMEGAIDRRTADLEANEDLANPENRTEEFLAKIAGLVDTLPEGEYTRLEMYLKYIAQNGSGSSNFPPIITKQPENLTVEVYEGATYSGTMSVEVAGPGPFTYQWESKTPTTLAWANTGRPGYNTSTLSPLGDSNPRIGYQFRCKITNANGSVYSEPATINPYAGIAEPFTANKTYVVGAYCTRLGVLYRCTTEHTGAWNASNFAEVNIGGDIANYLPTLFAPAGFGLGSFSTLLASTDDLDDVKSFGLFSWANNSPPANVPNSSLSGYVLSMFDSATRGVQLGFTVSSDGPKMYIRQCLTGSFSEWTTII